MKTSLQRRCYLHANKIVHLNGERWCDYDLSGMSKGLGVIEVADFRVGSDAAVIRYKFHHSSDAFGVCRFIVNLQTGAISHVVKQALGEGEYQALKPAAE